jgi:hypothetical protein
MPIDEEGTFEGRSRPKSPKLLEYEAWVQDWLRKHPLPPMSKKARWRIVHHAWLEWRHLVRKAEKEVAKRVSVTIVPCVREREKYEGKSPCKKEGVGFLDASRAKGQW